MQSSLSQTDRWLSNAVFIGVPLAVGWLTGRYERAPLPYRRTALPARWSGDPRLVLARDIFPAILFTAAFLMGIQRKYNYLRTR
jgi:hypothetical protein